MPHSLSTYEIVCFGEVLWDHLPAGRFPGGAPLNVAYHLNRLGCNAWLVSTVGNDTQGTELLQALDGFGLKSDFIGVDPSRKTGVVEVKLTDGQPAYEIARDVAWDHIVIPAKLGELCRSPDAIIFGSLAMRGIHNRHTLARLLANAPTALKVFDANLRPPFDDTALLRSLAQRADLIKLNDDEVGALLDPGELVDDLEHGARALARRYDCDRVCITAGAKGAGLLDRDDWLWVQSERVTVCDTVGAGDAFLAALVAGLMHTPDQPDAILAAASRLAGFVASQPGATPDHALRPGRPVSGSQS